MDRNIGGSFQRLSPRRSPSSRRAWIEILFHSFAVVYFSVALLAEGVDRNMLAGYSQYQAQVALLAEGVDRNLFARIIV